ALGLAADGTRIAIYKMGAAGAVTFDGQQALTTGIYPVAALKPTGAGDAFLGGFLAGLAAGNDLRTAVLRGAATAAIVVTRVGCAPAMPTADEVAAFQSQTPCPREVPDAHTAP